MKSETEIREYLINCEYKAIVSLAANKWERFGYWGGQSVHLRKILGLSSSPSPLRDFAELARKKLNK
uniref:Uncharacterized protein n=1 Tax=viral metagenome TaxID=1070528 RepID=A0A6M3IQG5_9ZZZZ